jgi:hypothetical protein
MPGSGRETGGGWMVLDRMMGNILRRGEIMNTDQLLYDLIHDFRGTTEIDTTEGEAMIRAVMYLHGKGYVRIVKTGVPVHFKYVRRPEDD